MNCFLCGDYGCSEEAHDSSLTHTYNSFNYFLSQRSNKINLRTEEQKNIEDQINLYRDRMNGYLENKVYDCGGIEDGSCEVCFEGLEECLEHEKKCLKFKRDIVVKPEKKLLSNEKAQCLDCGKIYYHTTKLHPKYALNRHKKTCSKNKGKNCKTIIRNFINDANESQLLEIVAFLNKFET